MSVPAGRRASQVPTPTPSAFAPPFSRLVAGIIALATGLLAPLLPLGMAPALITLSVLAGGLVLWRVRMLPTLPRSLLLPLALFWLVGTLSVVWTPVPVHGLAQSITFLYEGIPALLLIGLLSDLDREQAARIMRAAIWGLGIGLALFTIELLFDQPLYRLAKALEGAVIAEDRALNRPSVILALLVWPVAMALVRRWGGAALLLPVLYFVVTLFTPSASAVVGSIVGLSTLALAWYWPRLTAGLWMALTLLGFAACVPIGLALGALDPQLLADLPFSFAHRVGIWHFVAQRAADYPLFGWGLDASRAIPDGQTVLHGLVMEGQSLPLHPHNIFLQTRLELGWVGSILLSWLGIAILRWVLRQEPMLRAFALAAYGCTLSIACFAYGAWQTWWICSQLFMVVLFVITHAARRGGADGLRPRP